MDARIKHTKKVVTKSFLTLLAGKDISRITVTEICKEAGVNRATFYKYYSGPSDLLNQIEDEHLAQLDSKLRKLKGVDLDEMTRVVMGDVRENNLFYYLFFLGSGYIDFKKKFIDTLEERYCEILRSYFPDMEEHKIRWLYYFIMTGIMGVFTRWLDNGEEQSFDEVLNFTVNFVNSNLKGQFKKNNE